MIERIDSDRLVHEKDRILDLFQNYYLACKDIVGPEDLYRSLFQRLENGALFLVWDDFGGFLIADKTTNAISKRREAFIWTVLNPRPEMKPLVLDEVYKWAKSEELKAIVFMAENPVNFKKIVEPFGYQLKIGYFEKEVA